MPLLLRLIVGSLLVVVGATLLTVGVLGGRSRLRRNRWVGIRTPATLRSEPAFVARAPGGRGAGRRGRGGRAGGRGGCC